MGSLLSSVAEEIQIFSRVKLQRASTEGDNGGKLGDDPENYTNTTPDSISSQLKVVLLDVDAGLPLKVVIVTP